MSTESNAEDFYNEIATVSEASKQEIQIKAYLLSPNPTLILSRALKCIDLNQSMLEYVVDQFSKEIKDNSPEKVIEFLNRPEAGKQLRFPVAEYVENIFYHNDTSVHSEVVLDNNHIPTNIYFERFSVENNEYIAIYITRLAQSSASSKEVLIQSELLASINIVAGKLMGAYSDTFDLAIWESLCELGRAAKVDRAYVWEDYLDDGEMCCRQTYEWSEGAEPQQGNELVAHIPYSEIPYLRSCMLENKGMSGLVSLFPDGERELLQAQGIISIVLIPVYYAGNLWGFLGFDDCHNERAFYEYDKHALQSAAMMIVTAIERNKTDAQRIKNKQRIEEHHRLLLVANTTASQLLEENSTNFTDTLMRIMQNLAEHFDVERAYVWRKTTKNNVFYLQTIVEWVKNEEFSRNTPSIPYDKILENLNEIGILATGGVNCVGEELQNLLRDHYNVTNLKATLVLPITIHDEFWGFIGLDDYKEAESFSELAVDVMRSVGIMIATALQKRELNESLIIAKEEALVSARAKSDFLSRMSHEIRTPMNAIIGMNSIARKSDDQSKIKYCLEKIDLASQQLLSVINDVLDMSKIEANKLEILEEEFEFDEMLNKVLNIVQVKMYEKNQNFRLEFEEVFTRYMLSDELRISQMLINLLNNAVKFTPVGGNISVLIKQTEISEDTSVLYFEVRDTGIGISSENIGKLFNSFEQADGAITRKYGGTGLGLVICKNIAELLNGRVWVESEEGCGSRFMLEIKVGWGANKNTTKQWAQPEDMRVLIVDEDENNLDYITMQLTHFKLSSDKAQTGARAIQLVKDEKKINRNYNIIFFNWEPFNEKIKTTIRELKELSPQMVFVAMINVQNAELFFKDLNIEGISHYLTKPILPSSTFNKINEIVGNLFIEKNSQIASIDYDWSSKRLLLVEDVEINREIVIGILEGTHISIDTASNGLEALEKVQEFAGYDVILMDVQMPLMDGFVATEKIRALENEKARNISILAMTANAFKEDVEKCMAVGMNGHIAKPVDVDEFFAKLANIFDK